MDSLLDTIGGWLVSERASTWVRAGLLLVFGLVFARLLTAIAGRFARRFGSVNTVMLVRRLVFWTLAGLVVASVLKQLGFDLGVLLGAAGILTVALGFASQTSASNLISGLFLAVERSFEVGDAISVGATTGEVLSIDLLSVKLRTFDNRFVRVPNESLIKADFINFTRFPIRRADILVSVAYKEDLARVRRLLFELAASQPKVLEEPRPLVFVLGFGASGVDLQFSCWAPSLDFFQTKSDLYEEVKRSFDAEGIEIPFPHVSLYAGAATGPFPVKVVPGQAGGEL
jgi:small-conductance mechanosensitive channel